jgi:hypothetical protein
VLGVSAESDNRVRARRCGVEHGVHQRARDREHDVPDPIGTTVRRALLIGGTRCDGLRFTALTDGISTDADSVNVTRTSANTWLVESQPYPDNKAYCRLTGQEHHVNVRFAVVADRPLP